MAPSPFGLKTCGYVGKWWNECNVNGWEGFKFMKKLYHLRRKLIEWNKDTFRRLEINKNLIWDEIQAIYKKMENDKYLSPKLTDKT